MLEPQTIQRLQHLCRFFERRPLGKHFNMENSWVQHRGRGRFEALNEHIGPNETPQHQDLLQCGMQACALGWAATLPKFRAMGLELVARYQFDNVRSFWPRFHGNTGYSAAQKFFGLSYKQAMHLFGGHVVAPTGKAWAKRCRAFLKANK